MFVEILYFNTFKNVTCKTLNTSDVVNIDIILYHRAEAGTTEWSSVGLV